jgi:hypothetical protein
MQDDPIPQQPTRPQQLVLLFHGVGSKASDLAPLGRTLAPHMPDALFVSVQAPDAQGSGWQWFSVRGVTEANRPARVAATMQRFVQAVRDRQQASGVDSSCRVVCTDLCKVNCRVSPQPCVGIGPIDSNFSRPSKWYLSRHQRRHWA